MSEKRNLAKYRIIAGKRFGLISHTDGAPRTMKMVTGFGQRLGLRSPYCSESNGNVEFLSRIT
jgi:hypothetical protein